MKINESGLDRIIRVALGIVLLALALIPGIVSGALTVIFIVLGAVALLTGIVGVCPLYMLLKIKTK
jgi:hypothetical protein